MHLTAFRMRSTRSGMTGKSAPVRALRMQEGWRGKRRGPLRSRTRAERGRLKIASAPGGPRHHSLRALALRCAVRAVGALCVQPGARGLGRRMFLLLSKLTLCCDGNQLLLCSPSAEMKPSPSPPLPPAPHHGWPKAPLSGHTQRHVGVVQKHGASAAQYRQGKLQRCRPGSHFPSFLAVIPLNINMHYFFNDLHLM